MSRLPLVGRVVVVTRRREQGGGLREALAELGARVIELPALEVTEPADRRLLDEALRGLERFDWVTFTSVNAVRAVTEALERLGLPLGVGERGPRIAVVGQATAEALHRALPEETVGLVPEAGGSAADLVRSFLGIGVEGARILLPVSSRGRDELERGLAAGGAEVFRVVAYETAAPPGLTQDLEVCLAQAPDLFVFASPSAVEGLAGAAGGRLEGVPAVAIGPTTEDAVRSAGLKVVAVAAEPSVPGLVDAVVRAFGTVKA